MPPADYRPIEQFTIPDEVKEYLRSKGILNLNKAQIQAIEDGLLEDGNFVASTFTGTGKTVMAHIKMVQALKSGKKMIYIAPLKSIVVEKARQDFKFYEKYGWKFIDSTDLAENERNRIKYENYDGIVMTFEKLDSIMNKTGTQMEWLKQVGLVVVDEGHEISDEERGAVLESALTKIRIISHDQTRILLLSAVLPNVGAIAKWLKAKYCNIEWRPVDLEVGFVMLSGEKKGNRWRDDFDDEEDEDGRQRQTSPQTLVMRTGNISHITKVQQTSPLPNFKLLEPDERYYAARLWAEKAFQKVHTEENATDPVWPVVKKTLDEGGQALVFCKSRPDTERKARKIAGFIGFQNSPSQALEKSKRKSSKSDGEKDVRAQPTLPEIMAASELTQDDSIVSVDDDEDVSIEKSESWSLEQYARYLKQFDPQLYALVINGVAFHHAGLDLRARSKIEQAYREKKIKVIVSTPTLIAGVNLPARLVIFDSVMRFTDEGLRRIPKKEFVNGCGRAGRVGLDSVGVAVFVDKDFTAAVEYLNKPVEQVSSQLTRSALFQILCTMKRNEDGGLEFTTVNEINKFFSMTFSYSLGVNIAVQEYIDTLEKYGLIQRHSVTGAYKVTKLGAEAVNYYLHPGTAYMFSVLIDALKAKVEGKRLDLDKEDMTTDVLSVQVPDKITLDTIIHTVVQTKEFANHRKVKDKGLMHEYFEHDKKDFVINSEYEEPEIISAVMALHAKMEMYDLLPDHYAKFQQVYKNFGDGDFKMMQENMDWLLEALLSMARVKLGHGSPTFQTVSKTILMLKKRMKKMVREELVDVCRVKHIGRKRALVLKSLNILTLEAIINPANEQKLREGLGNSIAEQAIESAVQILARMKSTGINN
jgi:replicative superfamily II helicase